MIITVGLPASFIEAETKKVLAYADDIKMSRLASEGWADTACDAWGYQYERIMDAFHHRKAALHSWKAGDRKTHAYHKAMERKFVEAALHFRRQWRARQNETTWRPYS